MLDLVVNSSDHPGNRQWKLSGASLMMLVTMTSTSNWVGGCFRCGHQELAQPFCLFLHSKVAWRIKISAGKSREWKFLFSTPPLIREKFERGQSCRGRNLTRASVLYVDNSTTRSRLLTIYWKINIDDVYVLIKNRIFILVKNLFFRLMLVTI